MARLWRVSPPPNQSTPGCGTVSLTLPCDARWTYPNLAKLPSQRASRLRGLCSLGLLLADPIPPSPNQKEPTKAHPSLSEPEDSWEQSPREPTFEANHCTLCQSGPTALRVRRNGTRRSQVRPNPRH